MFKKIFALALVLILVAICARRPMDVPLIRELPNTCAANQFAATVDELDDLAEARDKALARIEALHPEEPTEYVTQWQKEMSLLRGLDSHLDEMQVPHCLAHAKDLFGRYLEESLYAAEQRGPDKDFEVYRHARESSDAIYAQYKSEVKLEEKNRR